MAAPTDCDRRDHDLTYDRARTSARNRMTRAEDFESSVRLFWTQVHEQGRSRCLLGRPIQQLLIRRPFLGNLLHKLFSGNKSFLNQQLRQCVCLHKALRQQVLPS